MNGSSDYRKSILEMARGGVMERVDYEMVKVMDNIFDANTNPTAKRKITLTVEFKHTDDRQSITVDYTVKSALAPTNPVRTMLYASDEDTVIEMTPQIPGQMDVGGAVQEAPAQLKLIKFA